MDRSHYPTRKLSLRDAGRDSELTGFTPEQLVGMVWELTKQAWTFKDGRFDESRLRRDVVRVVRGGRWIDILTQISGVEFEPAWARKLILEVDGQRLPFLGREDLLTNKRASGRARDLADIAALEGRED